MGHAAECGGRAQGERSLAAFLLHDLVCGKRWRAGRGCSHPAALVTAHGHPLQNPECTHLH